MSSGQMQKYKRAIHIAVAVLFTIGILALAWSYISLDELAHSMDRVNPWMVILTVLVYGVVIAVRAIRFVYAGARLTYQDAFGVAAVHSALLRVMPLRSGELAYGVLLKKLKGGGFAEGVASILMLRILDLAVVLPVGAAVIVGLLSGSSMGLIITALVLAGAALLTLFFALGPLSRKVLAIASKKGQSEKRSFLAKVADVLVKAYDLPIKRRIALLGLTVGLWTVIIVWMNLCMMAAGAVGVFKDGFTASILGMLGSILPVSLLGSFGPMESGFALGLSAIGQARETAVAGSIVVSMITFIDCWAIGLPSWAALLTKGFVTDAARRRRIFELAGGFLFALFGALLLVKRIGYSFETNDQFQYLLLPYREIFDNFLKGDWFTWQTSHYHLVFSWIVRGLHGLTGDGGFAQGMFAIHFLVLFTVAFGLWRLAGALDWHWLAAAFALLAVAFVKQLGIAGSIVNHGMLLPADMAFPPFLLALAAWVEKRYVKAGLWLGLAGLFHANFAVLGPLLIAPVEIIRLIKYRDWKSTVKMAACYVVLASPTLVSVAASFVVSDSAPGALDVMFRIRSPHHYLPSFDDVGDLLWVVALIAAGLPVWMARGTEKVKSGGVALLLALIGFQVVAAVATKFEVAVLIRLFFWRLSIPLILISAMAAGEMITRAFRSFRFESIFYAVAAVMLIASFSNKGVAQVVPQIELGGSGLTAPSLIPIAVAAVLMSLFNKKLWARISAAVLSAAVVCWFVMISVPGLAVDENKSLDWEKALDGYWEFKPVQIAETKRGRNDAIYRWIKEKTPEDAVFLAPPGMNDFRLKARRAVFVDWKCCPMKGDEVVEWKRRMLAEMGAEDFPATGYKLYNASNRRYFSRPLKYLTDLARKENLTHILTYGRKGSAETGLKKIFAKGRFVIYEVEPK